MTIASERDATGSTNDWFLLTEQVLLEADPCTKANAAIALHQKWSELAMDKRESALALPSQSSVRRLDDPGRPAMPKLVEPRQLSRRSIGSPAGRIALLHSLAHIEFNAINLALDAVYRFRSMPAAYVTDWLKVGADEGVHYQLLANRLATLGSHYGDLPAHDGLWEMARRTDHDVLVRMALVPRILEARGLDVAPPMIDKLKQQNDADSAAILQRIYTDEITHVAVGNRWFAYLCKQRSLDGVVVFKDLLRGRASAYLRSPYNETARLQAGFTQAELHIIRQMEAEYKAANLQ